MTPLIELREVEVRREGRTILGPLSLSISQGEPTAILGPNGSGKSTLLALLSGEIHPYAGRGELRILGERGLLPAQRRTRLGIVSSDARRGLLHDPTAGEMAASGRLGTYGLATSDGTELLSRVDLASLAYRRLSTLSTGEAQRVLIARALAPNPVGLVLDEPTSGLDLGAAHRFRGLLSRLIARGTSLVLVTHHLEEILPEIRRVILLREGSIAADGPPASVLTRENLAHLFDLTPSALPHLPSRTSHLSSPHTPDVRSQT